MKFYIIDVFTNQLFGGNPAGIVILDKGADFPDAELMQATATELRYSETAFVKTLEEGKFNIRYFTPSNEVELCGHATIGSFMALLKESMIDYNGIYQCKTLSGDINVKIEDGSILMDMADPVEIGSITEEDKLEKLYSIMGCPMPDFKEGPLKNIYPRLISTGLPDIMMPVATKEDLDKMKPNMADLTELSKEYKVVGVHGFTIGNSEITAYCRNFAPLYDIDEESATGTSNGALTYFFYLNNLIKLESNCKFFQGETMGRPSIIETKITANNNGKASIKVGGSGVILAEGTIEI